MKDPLEALLVESEGVFLLQTELSKTIGSLADAERQAEQLALSLGKPVFVFRAVAKVEAIQPVTWTILAAHGPSIDDRIDDADLEG